MKKITEILGKTIPLAMNNVDTDLMIPAQYLTGLSMSGYGQHLFQRLRDNDPNFVFNQEKFSGASILITQDNFGCGSSREHAVWALLESGIQAVIAESFADIFSSNSAKNGLVLITQPKEIIEPMVTASQVGDYLLTINIADKSMVDNHHQDYRFEMEDFYHYCLINGLDNMDYLLAQKKIIEQWTKKRGYLDEN